MTPDDGTLLIADPSGLLERAIGYALGTLQGVTAAALSRPTPCADWDVRQLLHHVIDSLEALCEGAHSGQVGPVPVAADERAASADLVAACRDRAARLLDACSTTSRRDRVISIGGMPLTAGIMAGVGAVEIAAHGWDISQSSGRCQPIPSALAADLLAVAAVFVPRGGRRCLFADPVAVPAQAGPSDRLVAFLGRSPRPPGGAR